MKKAVTKDFLVKTINRWKGEAKAKAISKTGEGAKPPLTDIEELILEVFSNPNLPNGVRVSNFLLIW